ncbi:hypothetical protein LV779_33090 [Streptomyces thinghirensis]|nr:hypothetical protein [Streptomyces thinghirensis]
MYADKITPAMERAIDETNRRREKQVAFNKANGNRPLRRSARRSTTSSRRSPARTSTPSSCSAWATASRRTARPPRPRARPRRPGGGQGAKAVGRAGRVRKPADRRAPAAELAEQIEDLTTRMQAGAATCSLRSRLRLRDEVSEMKKELRQMKEAGPA